MKADITPLIVEQTPVADAYLLYRGEQKIKATQHGCQNSHIEPLYNHQPSNH